MGSDSIGLHSCSLSQFAIVNRTGAALDSTANATVKYRTVNRNLNG